MKSGLGWTLFGGVLFIVGLIAPRGPAIAGNCVLYARAETGVALYGAAGGWWDEAAGLYQRGHVPEVGSILVFKRTGFMPLGHVAVVSKIVGPGMVLVDHSNWYRGSVTHATPVIDTSPDHDWTSVAVMNIAAGEFGRDSPTYGFVYPETGARGLVTARATGGFNAYAAATPADYRPDGSPDLFHFAVADDGWQARVRHPRLGRKNHAARYSRRRGVRVSEPAVHDHPVSPRHASRTAYSVHHANSHPMHAGAPAARAGHGAIHAARGKASRAARHPA